MRQKLRGSTAFVSAISIMAVAGFGVAQEAAAQSVPVNNMVFFGDSLSDPGNQPGLLGGANQPPSPPYSQNRFSNGDVYAQIVPGLFGVNPANVTNTAVGGAFTGQIAVAPGVTVGNIGTVTDPANPLNAVDTLSQVNNFIAGGGTLNSNSVATVFAGANDYFLTLNTLNPTASTLEVFNTLQASVASAVGNITTAAQTLAANGAGTIVLVNLPNLGATPQFLAAGPSAVAAASTVSDLHNGAIAQLATTLQASGVKVQVVDAAGLFNTITANPAAFGFTNTTEACINTACVSQPQAAQNQFVFFDGVHPTTAAHNILAQAFSDTFTAPFSLAATANAGQSAAIDYSQDIIGRLRHFDLETRDSQVFGDIDYLNLEFDSEGSAFGSDFDMVRANVGLAYGFSENFLAGFGLAYDNGDSDTNGAGGGFDFMALRVSGFADYTIDRFGLGVAVAYSNDDYDITRQTAVTGLSTNGDADGRSISVVGEGRADFDLGPVMVTPAVRLGYIQATVDDYRESGANGLNRQVSEQDVDVFFGEIGAELSGRFDVLEAGVLKPRLGAYLRQDFDDSSRSVTSALTSSPGVTTTTEIDGRDSTTGRVELGLDLVNGPFTFGVQGDYQTSNPDGFGVTGRMLYKF